MKQIDAGLAAILADIERERTPERLLALAWKLQKVLSERKEAGNWPSAGEAFDDSGS